MRGFSTNAIHAGQEPDPTTGAVITPLHLSSTFAQDGVGGTRAGGYEYARSANPTRTALQECLAALEGGRHARAFGSGMGATDVLLRVLLRPGDHLVIPHDAYGGTFRLVDKVLAPWGVEYTPVDLGRHRRPARGAAADHPRRLVRDADQPAAGHRGHRRGRRRHAREAGRPARRRQHLRLALPAAAARAGRGRRAALHHQVRRRALRRRRRRARDQRRRARRAADVHPERRRLGARARSTTGSRCAGRRRSRCAWSGTATTPSASPRCSPATRPWRGCSTPACPSTPATRWRPSRCAASAAWCRSCWPAAGRRRCGCARRRSCSPSPSRSAASSR